MTITKRIIYSTEDFDLTFEPIEDSIKIKKTKNGYEIKYLSYETDPFNPFEDSEGIGNFIHWTNYGNEQYLKYCEVLGYDPDTREIINKGNIDAVSIDKYEHSGISYSVKGEGYKCRWDTSSAWAVWLPDNICLEILEKIKNKKKRYERAKEMAREACITFNQWSNGEVYITVKETYDKNKEQIDYDCVGGFFGYEDSLKALETEI